MSSTEIAVRNAGGLAVPQGARALGQRVKPIIRLGMGVKNPAKKGAPDKTDYFTVRGDERAVAKFKSIYGETPNTVKIMVPSELGLALDISYRSFVGGQSEDGGRPLALGFTNFATLGYVGGPDVLRVWAEEGEYIEVETLGLDETGKPLDDVAREYGIEVHATFTFTIPEVLGWGSFAAVTSKGKKSADNLSFKLGQIYSAFGNKAPWAFDREEPPVLVLKPDTAMTRFKDKETKKFKWGKSRIFVLDIVIPEAFHDMRDRLAAQHAEIAPAGAPAALYGRELETGDAAEDSGPDNPDSSGEGDSAEETASAGGKVDEPSPDDEPPEQVEGEVADDDETKFQAPVDATDDPEVLAANDAAEALVPFGKHKGMTLRELVELGDEGSGRIRWALKQWKTDPFKSQVWAFAKVYAPDVHEVCLAELEADGG